MLYIANLGASAKCLSAAVRVGEIGGLATGWSRLRSILVVIACDGCDRLEQWRAAHHAVVVWRIELYVWRGLYIDSKAVKQRRTTLLVGNNLTIQQR